MANCIICGAELVEGKCPNAEVHFKKMCLNCIFCNEGVCTNEENMSAVRDKILQSVPSSYEVVELQLKPVTLKNPLNKCGKYAMNESLVLSALNA